MAKYYCPYCNYYFSSQRNLDEHIAEDHMKDYRGKEVMNRRSSMLDRITKTDHYCPYCNLYFSSLRALKDHLTEAHGK